ncbi:MAG: Si-specific NAD(P)(+) transhydrogenase [Proteobacteria bacterium]|nr:MAG: Si-specific NAD(P)(+) transhydrogenase [Pseudomonadota bacterium]
MSSLDFDLVVIGSGPGGTRAAIQAAKLGKRVVIVEKEKAGGSCVHTGTIPSKSLREAALADAKPAFHPAMEKMRGSVQVEASVVKQQLERNGVEFIAGTAEFIDAFTIRAAGQNIKAKNFVIATGTRPVRADEFHFGPDGVRDSDSILNLKKKPRSLLVLGAGVIGCEYASIFARLGTKVTLAERRHEFLRSVDEGVIEALRMAFAETGIELLMGAYVGPITRIAGENPGLSMRLNEEVRTFDEVLICMGRQPNTDELGLGNVGISVDVRGFISVDRATYQTNISHIYAVGDVIGPPALAAASAEQGRIAACHIFGVECPPFPASFPYGIYTIPEISWAGATEAELREKNIAYVAGTAPFAELARGIISGNRGGFIKLLVQPESRVLLGVHVIGYGATELVHIGQVAMALGAPIDFFLENVFNYPTFAEAYKVAALNATNRIGAANITV